MAHTKYMVSKLRFGENMKFGPWKYDAHSINQRYYKSKPSERGIMERYFSIDALAKELSTFPEITNAEFIPEETTVHLCKGGKLTQRGIITDDELAELAFLIFQYSTISQENNK